MNIYEKLQTARVELQACGIKKSGKNTHSNYTYYELADFLPKINELCQEHKLFPQVEFDTENAILTIRDAEKPEDVVIFTSPMAEAKLPACHPIQNIGAVQTYQRRYLYMAAFEIVEQDALDATTKPDEAPKKDPESPQQEHEPPKGDITEPQRKKMWSMTTKIGLKPEEVKQIMTERYGVDDSKKLSKKNASDFIKYLGRLEKGEITWTPKAAAMVNGEEVYFDANDIPWKD